MVDRQIDSLHDRHRQTCLWTIKSAIIAILQAVEELWSRPMWIARINIYSDYHASFGDA